MERWIVGTILIILVLVITGAASVIIKAFFQTTGELIKAEGQVNNELNNAINQAINESCKSLDETNCKIIKSNVDMYKNVQDVVDTTNKLKTAQNIVKKIK